MNGETQMEARMLMAALVAAFALPAAASHAPEHGAKAASDKPLVAGEVRRIDKQGGKITLKHEAIPNLDMAGMTMVFNVKDRAMLEAVKAGDRVRFKADNVGGALTVTEIRAAN